MNRSALYLSVIVIVASAGNATAQTAFPYAGQEQRAIKALSEEDIRDLREGRGMGLAKAAELNSYPGPLHVLQLADQLGLSDAQRKATESLKTSMRDRAQAIGAKIIEAERSLDLAFANGRVDPPVLRSQIAAIADLQSELRFIHLEAHVAQRPVLTPEQISRYDTLRGYGGNRVEHGSKRHGGG